MKKTSEWNTSNMHEASLVQLMRWITHDDDLETAVIIVEEWEPSGAHRGSRPAPEERYYARLQTTTREANERLVQPHKRGESGATRHEARTKLFAVLKAELLEKHQQLQLALAWLMQHAEDAAR